MNTPTASETHRWPRGALRLFGSLALVGILLMLTLWAAAALHFDVRVSRLRTRLAAAYLLAVLAMWFWVKGRWLKTGRKFRPSHHEDFTNTVDELRPLTPTRSSNGGEFPEKVRALNPRT